MVRSERGGVSGLLRLYAPAELGPDGYPPEWHATIKHLVREEAAFRCVRCGHPYRNGEHGTGEWSLCDERCTHRGEADTIRWQHLPVLSDGWAVAGGRLREPAGELVRFYAIEARWRILTVHHLDGDKANCRWWNLAALCQRCHLSIQSRVVLARVWPWDHSDWFKPYVAGWYAHAYLGEELTREEAVARMDELLALERLG